MSSCGCGSRNRVAPEIRGSFGTLQLSEIRNLRNMPTLRRRSPVMKLFKALVIGGLVLFLGTAANCSRARVESMNKMNEGVVAAQQKRFDDAVKLLDSAANIDPQNEQAFWNMAIVHMEMRKY